MIDYQHIAELALMGAANAAASFAAMRARLNALDKRCDTIQNEANRSNERIDAILVR